ncbi:unnamed protein product [Caenorhabditis angaria]|uniref:Uncharacterized protein n=1 Tax=Caenorhabditis angaria TaxID=860376 RepID=A0A9P1IT39_9PELO|nr:unnamed protein product [Caenorhabditis angaria]
MSSMKWVIFQCCAWSAALDITFSGGTTPFVLFPTLAGVPLGVFSSLKIGVIFQTFFEILLFVGVGVSNICIMENRYSVMRDRQFMHPILIYFLNFVGAAVVLIVMYFDIPEQNEARRIVFEL